MNRFVEMIVVNDDTDTVGYVLYVCMYVCMCVKVVENNRLI